jgi:hypothetical protein
VSWQLASFLILGVALVLGFAWYERSRPSARVLALVAALAALAVVGRIAFAPFPNVKPTTDIVLFAGYALGGAPGFAVGAVAAVVSDIFFLQGPWTPWHMAAWGGVGLAGGALGTLVRGRTRRGPSGGEAAPRELGRWSLAAACGLAGLGFGLVMDLYMWTLGAEQTVAAYAVVSGRSLPFNVAHVVGNVTLSLIIGPPLVRALGRYRRRFEARWPAPGAVGAPAAPAVVASALSLALFAFTWAPAAEAASSTERAARYLEGAQNSDGGFGRTLGGPSAPPLTDWASLGLAGAGRNPRDVKRGRSSALDYLKRNASSIDDTNDLERAILVVRAAGVSPRSFAGRDLYRELLRRREADGSFGAGKIDFTTFGIFALRAAGESAGSVRVRRAADWLTDQQGADGGFPANQFARSDVDDTGAAVHAFAAAGYSSSHPDVARALRYLADAQASSGGFPQMKGGAPNAQSTAYALQGLVAIGRGGGSSARRARTYLRSRQAPDGSIRQSAGSSASPVWPTSQAILALAGQTFPIDPVPRRPAATPPPAGAGGPGGGGAGGNEPKGTQGGNESGGPKNRPAEAARAGTGTSGRGVGGSGGGGSGTGGAGPAGGRGSAGDAGGIAAPGSTSPAGAASAAPPKPGGPGAGGPVADPGGLASPGALDLTTPPPGSSAGLDLGVLGAAKGSPGGALGELFSHGAALATGPAASNDRGAGAGSGQRGGIHLAWLLVALAAVSALAAAGAAARRVAARRARPRARRQGAPLQHLS